MTRLIRNTIVLAPVALLLWTATAQATTQTGQMAGYVSDPTGLPVPDAVVTLTGANMMGKRSAVSNEDGEFRFLHLPPGLYTVACEHELYKKQTQEGIEVGVGRTTTVDLVLEPPVAEEAEAYIVEGAVPAIDVEQTTLGGSISDSFSETVPTSRDYQGITALVPGVVGSGNVNVLGSWSYGNMFLLDGINITDPVTNTFSNNFNFDAIQEVEVLTGGRDAEYGNAMGGVINVVTKSGGNDFTADASLYYSSAYLQVRDKGEEELNNQMLQANVNVGGPIIKDELWFYFSGEVPWATSQLPPSVQLSDIFPDQDGALHPARDFRAFYGLGKLTWQPLSWQQFKLLVQGDPTTIYNEDQSYYVHPDAETQRYQGGVLAALQSETFLTPEVFWKTSLGYKHSRLHLFPMSEDFDTPSRYNSATNATTMNSSTWQDDNRYRMQLHSSVSYVLDDLLGEHQLKAGIDAQYTWEDFFVDFPGGGVYNDDGLDPANPESAWTTGLPYQYTRMVENEDTTITGDTEGLFIQDAWKPFRTLTIRPGLRFDSSRLRDWEGNIVVHTNTLSPRFNVAWDPFDDRRTQLRFGYNQYVDTGFLYFSGFVGKSSLTRTYEYNPITGEYDDFVRESGGVAGAEAKPYMQEAFDQQRPRAHELIFGAGRELVPDLSLSLDFIYRYYENQWEDDESNAIWNELGTDVIGWRNGEQRFIWSLGALEEAFTRYYGFIIEMNKRFSDNWEMQASYTWSWTEGTAAGLVTSHFDNPQWRDAEFGFSPQDVRHVLKIYASYRLPYGFVLGGNVGYNSGFPYRRIYYHDYYQDYYGYRAPNGYDITDDGELVEVRTPERFYVSARVVWQLKELTGQRLDLMLDIFNLLNSRPPGGFESRDVPMDEDPRFGDPTTRGGPLNVQLGIRYRY